MKLFSDCVGNCCICAVAGGLCLAGIGDDDFVPASKEEIINRLDKNENYTDRFYRDRMIDFLKNEYNYDYKEKMQ